MSSGLNLREVAGRVCCRKRDVCRQLDDDWLQHAAEQQLQLYGSNSNRYAGFGWSSGNRRLECNQQSSTIAQPILSGAFKSKKHKRQMQPRDLRFPIRQLLRQLQMAPRPTVASLPRTSPLSDNNQNIQQGFVYKV